MHTTLKSIQLFSIALISIVLLFCFTTNTKAQTPQEMQKQMDDLRQQISGLKADLTLLKSVINTNGNGALTVTNAGNRVDAVGSQLNINVGGANAISIGANKTESIRGSSSVTVGLHKDENIGMNMSASVGNNFNVSVGSRYQISAGRDITIEAGDQIILKCGTANIILKKNGDIELKGNVILPPVARDILIKGTRIQ